MKLRGLLPVFKWIIGLMLFYPFVASAHLIAITATSPFPVTLQTSTSATATYTVTNISRIPLTVVDKSQFPVGLAITSTTCGVPIKAGASCLISLKLVAPAVPGIFATELKEWAKPSADGVTFPIRVAIVSSTPTTQFTITASAGANGTLSPSGSLTIAQGGSQTFTATPNAGFTVSQWFVDGVLAQTGGTTFTLSNITANHTVSVSFELVPISLGVTVGFVSSNFFVGYSTDSGVNWIGQTLFHGTSYNAGILRNVACTGSVNNASCVTAAFSNSISRAPILYTQSVGTIDWTEATVTPASLGQEVSGAAATGGDTNPLMVLVGFNNELAVKPDRATQWTIVPVTFAPSQTFAGVSCSGGGTTAYCAAVSSDVGGVILQAASNFTTYNSTPGQTNGWSPIAGNISVNATFAAVSCTGDFPNTQCAAVGADAGSSMVAYKASNTLLWQQATLPISVPSLFGISCSSSVCVAIGEFPNVIMTSFDAGVTWSVVNSPSITNFTPNAVSCAGSVCAVVGQDTSSAPAILSSTDSGASWSFVPIIGGPALGNLAAVNCTSSGSSVSCYAGGADNTNAFVAPLTLVRDSSGNWNYVASMVLNGVTTPMLSVVGNLFGTASTTLCPWKKKV